ncbi:MAG TPA: YebC/PmpR family DNA-binding transcriptional regulator [Tenuifilaceae bacterium]|jgi:YebC/PmpR family DNA-binding regulatory protein|nr:YebC/PmpR family DNA-binding transcriptional regulator [Bacteroidales bacterium]HNY08724.1 YebC/PmpR family DNA-binding transcriptional regulator [Tenuifilaceae bacterium]MBP8643014.1 YebC/PmpR family DNA-binding transcriptional regulator [Bacteroidales bacterium]NLI87869.1 YebC/PmpR family DNA-binding transcriptional regulator [Bacteroidales bacterium]HOA09203.1 YebC/PmpR family DNA-binding transcriptional regulator [Tenuifilaceae bacterium]
MSGHNKWSTIKRKKGALDAKRSKEFSRIIKEITVAVKESGSDPDGNPRLRLAINNAKGVNMPKDNIMRAISKAEKDPENFHELTFEGYGPGGIALFIECLTDNNNRTVSAIRSILTKRGGSLGTNGSLSFLFDRKGIFTIAKDKLKLDEVELDLIDAGAQSIDDNGDFYVVTTEMEDFGRMNKKLEELNVEVENASLQRIPNDYKTLDKDSSLRFLKLIDELEDNDDVQNVYHNLEMTDEVVAAMENE